MSEPVKAEVVKRSALDVVLLRLLGEAPKDHQFLRRAGNTDPTKYKQRCVLLASHFESQSDTYSTFAEVASVALDDGIGWAISGEGFNPSRSGSPVILGDGTVVAMFLSRPSVVFDRSKVDQGTLIQSRARILPLYKIPSSELDLAAIASSPGSLHPFLTRTSGTSEVARGQIVDTAFGISITELGNRISPSLPTYLIDKDGRLMPVSSLGEASLQALTTGSSIVRRVEARRVFEASPGYAFDGSPPRFVVGSQNPPGAPLPGRPCEGEADGGCFKFQDGRRSVEVRLYMFPGFDGRRAWFDAEMHLIQRKQ